MKRKWRNIPALGISALWLISIFIGVFFASVMALEVFKDYVPIRLHLFVIAPFFLSFLVLASSAVIKYYFIPYPYDLIIWLLLGALGSFIILTDIFYELRSTDRIEIWFGPPTIKTEPGILLVIPFVLSFVLTVFSPRPIEIMVAKFPIISGIILIAFVVLVVLLMQHNYARIPDGRGG